MQKYFNNVTDARGNALSNVSVTVKTLAGATATIYSDNSVTTRVNPITTDVNGYFEFYAADGRYSLTITGNGISTTIITDILLEDPADGSSVIITGGTIAGVSVTAELPPNRNSLQKTRAKLATMAAATTQLTLLTFGDSMSGFGTFATVGSLPYYLFKRVADRYGSIGSYVNSDVAASGAASVNGVTQTAFDTWPSGALPTLTGAGGVLTYTNSGSSALADTLKIYYIIEPGAGSFTVESFDVISGWAAEGGTVSAAGTKSLGIITIAKSLGVYRLRVTGVSGVVRFLPHGTGQFSATSISGVQLLNCFQGGINLSDMVNASNTTIFQAWLTNVAPDMVMWEMKEGTSTLAADLAAWLTKCKTVLPTADFLMLKTTPTAAGEDLLQNSIVDTFARNNQINVFDIYNFYATYANAVALGGLADTTHRSAAGNEKIAQYMSAALGLEIDPVPSTTVALNSSITGSSVTKSIKWTHRKGQFDKGIVGAWEIEVGYYGPTESKYRLVIFANYDSTYTWTLTHIGGSFSTASVAATTNTKTLLDLRLTLTQDGIYYRVTPTGPQQSGLAELCRVSII